MARPPRALWFIAAALVLAAIAAAVRLAQPPALDATLLPWISPKAEALLWVTPRQLSIPREGALARRLAELEAEVAALSTVSREQIDQLVGTDRLVVASGRFDWPRIRAALERAGFRVETFRDRELAVREDDVAVAFDEGKLLAGRLDQVREALHRKDQKLQSEALGPLLRALNHPHLSLGARAAGRVDPGTTLGADLAGPVGLGTVAVSIGDQRGAALLSAAVFPIAPARLGELDQRVRTLVAELKGEIDGMPQSNPFVRAVLESLEQASGEGAVLLEATVGAELVPADLLLSDSLASVVGTHHPPRRGVASPTFEALGPSPGATFEPGADIEHRWSAIGGVRTFLVDFSVPSAEGQCVFDAARKVYGTQLSARHDDPKQCLVWRVRPEGEWEHIAAGGAYTVGSGPGCALSADALRRCLAAATPEANGNSKSAR